jgi:hypothetical protein
MLLIGCETTMPARHDRASGKEVVVIDESGKVVYYMSPVDLPGREYPLSLWYLQLMNDSSNRRITYHTALVPL